MFRVTQLKSSAVDLLGEGITSIETGETLDSLKAKALAAANQKPGKKSSATEYY